MNTSTHEANARACLAVLDDARQRMGPESVARIERALATPRGPEGVSRFPELTARPWHDPAQLEAVQILDAAASDIQAELESALAKRRGFQAFRQQRDDFLSESHWKTMYFKVGGRPVDVNRADCPRTAAALDAIPVFSMAMFSALLPGGKIPPHRGPSNCRLTLHLGLRIPAQCGLTVDGETRTWTEGRTLAFDDTFEHSAFNDSDETRFVLYVDLWHPELTSVEVQFLAHAQQLMVPEDDPQRLEPLLAARAEARGHAWWD